MHDFSERLEIASREIDFQIKETKKQIDSNFHPEGPLEYKIRNSCIYYYVKVHDKDGKTRKKYLGTAGSPIVETYKEQRFLQLKLKTLEHDKKVIELAMKDYRDFTSDEIHRRLPSAYKDLPDQCYVDDRFQKLKDWAARSYQKNGYKYPLNASRACDGTRMRSKGETIWYDDLTFNGISFRYDSVIEGYDKYGSSVWLSPDFLTMDLAETNIAIEHLGDLQNDEYLNRNAKKMQDYQSSGYVIGENLLLTSDNKEHQTSSLAICQMIELLKIKIEQGC